MNIAYTSKTVIVSNDGRALMVTTFSTQQTFFSKVETQVVVKDRHFLMVGDKVPSLNAIINHLKFGAKNG